MSAAKLVHLSDVDLLLREVNDVGARSRLAKLGFDLSGVPGLQNARERLAAGVEHRWMVLYERARGRYGRGVAAVRDLVCQGCFVTLPTSAASWLDADALGLCASCGRLLYRNRG